MSAAVGLLAALLALGIASAPGWHELRWFAACAVCAALYNLANAPVTLAVSPATLVQASRLSLCFAALHGTAWYAYLAAQERRPLARSERIVVGALLAMGLGALVPGVMLGSAIATRVSWGGIVYRDGVPTAVGAACFAFYALALLWLWLRTLVRWRKGRQSDAVNVVALGALVVGSIHDSLAGAGLVRSPYVLDLALLVLVFSAGASMVSRFVASARALDQTARHLALAHAELVERERLAALGELAAVVAHEVRNPLAVIFNALASLPKTPPASDDHATLLAILKEEAERLRDIVSELLDFARPRPLSFAPANVETLVAAAVEAARTAVGAPESTVAFASERELPTLTCDAQLVHQAVVNLVNNAMGAPGRRGPVRVAVATLGRTRDEIEVRVEDDGEGVPEALRERIFTPFFSTRPTGSGLGLAVVRRCAEAHGGAAGVDAVAGGGASFWLRLPCRPIRTPAPAPEA